MDSVPKMAREQCIEAMRGKFEAILGGVADAVNDAPDGRIINASEETVRDLLADFRRVAYEAALQARIDAAEAASPPPKDGNGRTKRHKGRQERSVLTANGRVVLRRVRWHSPAEGSTTPIDAALDTAEATISLAVRELACRLNRNASNFEKAAANLARAAQIRMSGETLRRLVEAEGKAVLVAAATLAIGWTAADCRVRDAAEATKLGPARVYLGCDGVLVPLVTAAE